ncbi:MAG TPA: OmpA family protein [Methylomirabilota bacterium]|jgi:outer membrane protein OmpA-like peptidoglycan-associated protein
MKRAMVILMLCSATAAVVSGCATKKFVREQVGATEGRLGQRVDTQESELKQTAQRTDANAQGLDTANQRLQGVDSRLQSVDSRVGEVSALAIEAQRDARAAGEAVRETDRRFAGRNKLAALETKSVFFDFGKADVRDEGYAELEEIARALKADPDAVVELQGFADPRGTDAYNYRLTRDRVDAVIRHLVQRHGIELRRIHAVGMGKVPPEAGARADRDALAKSRRVDIVLLAPQS